MQIITAVPILHDQSYLYEGMQPAFYSETQRRREFLTHE